MLSYIKESQTEALPQGNGSNSGSGEASSDVSDSTFLTVSGREKSAQKSTVFVTSLFIVASVGLVLMAKKSHVQTADAMPMVDGKTQMEVAISRVTGVSSDMSLRMDEIVQKFYEFSDVSQVKADELNKNPFELFIMPVEIEHKEVFPAQNESHTSLLRQFNAEKEKLSLISIIQSESGSCCMINGVLLDAGQKINAFVVEAILPDHVQLVWQPKEPSAQALAREKVTVTLALED